MDLQYSKGANPILLSVVFTLLPLVTKAQFGFFFKLLNLRGNQLISTLAAFVFVPSVLGKIFQ
jgi:hypothetical protein